MSARPGPCGGHRATGVPTAIANHRRGGFPTGCIAEVHKPEFHDRDQQCPPKPGIPTEEQTQPSAWRRRWSGIAQAAPESHTRQGPT